jgi:hypothetical protein
MATQLEILDSTYNLLIFHNRHTSDEILSQLPDAPQHVFEIVNLEETHEDHSDIVSDSGIYYRIT